MFWTYQDDERKAIDDFEQTPLDPGFNSLGGPVTAVGFTLADERLLNNNSSDYPGGFTKDTSFYHDTLGLRLDWNTPGTYTTELPVGQRDVSMYTHLTLRVAKKFSGAQAPGPGVNLFVNVLDGNGNSAMWDLRTDQFDPVPHPFEGSEIANQSLMERRAHPPAAIHHEQLRCRPE